MADRVERRLKLPAKHGPAWRHGGSGWDVRGEPAAEESPPVRIDVHSPRRSRTR